MESSLPACVFVHCRHPNFYNWHRLHDVGLSSRPHKDVLDDACVGWKRVTSGMGAVHYVYAGYVLQRWNLPQEEYQGNPSPVEEGKQDARLETLRPLWQHEPFGQHSTWCGL